MTAELQAAQRAGSIPGSFEFVAANEASASSTTREQIRREASQATQAKREAAHRLYGPDHALES